jgi:ubiquinone/menaquinone biosynthesis C-methylase UbiE
MTQTASASEILRQWRENAPLWAKHGATIRRMFAPVTEALIEEADIKQGYSVLDVAGGVGEPSLTIAERVAPTGWVTCTDAINEMVSAAAREARRQGLVNVTFRQCDASALPFGDDLFDAVVSRLGVMFFPDPLASLGEMLRVAKPGRRISLAVWGRNDLNPFTYIVSDVVSRYVESPPADMEAPGAFRFAEPDKLASILRSAGAREVRERMLHFRIEAPITSQEFFELRWETSDTLRAKLAKLSAEQILRLTGEVCKAAQDYFPNNQMSFPAQMLVVTGRKAS